MDHDATVVEADGTEVRIAPLDVQYQNATIWGKLITNFAGPMNNFILGVVVFWILIFMQGGVRDVDTNQFHIMPQGPWLRWEYQKRHKLPRLAHMRLATGKV